MSQRNWLQIEDWNINSIILSIFKWIQAVAKKLASNRRLKWKEKIWSIYKRFYMSQRNYLQIEDWNVKDIKSILEVIFNVAKKLASNRRLKFI